MLTIVCTGCGRKLLVKDEQAGMQVKCPNCGQVVSSSGGPAAAVPAGGPSRPSGPPWLANALSPQGPAAGPAPGHPAMTPNKPTPPNADPAADGTASMGRRSVWPWFAGAVAVMVSLGIVESIRIRITGAPPSPPALAVAPATIPATTNQQLEKSPAQTTPAKEPEAQVVKAPAQPPETRAPVALPDPIVPPPNATPPIANPPDKGVVEAVVPPSVKTLGIEPVKAEPKTDPIKTEPSKVEPTKVEPVKTEPVKKEPIKTEPVKAEPPKTEPVKPVPVVEDPKQKLPWQTDAVAFARLFFGNDNFKRRIDRKSPENTDGAKKQVAGQKVSWEGIVLPLPRKTGEEAKNTVQISIGEGFVQISSAELTQKLAAIPILESVRVTFTVDGDSIAAANNSFGLPVIVVGAAPGTPVEVTKVEGE